MACSAVPYIGVGILALATMSYLKFQRGALPGAAFPTLRGVDATLIESRPLTHNSKFLRFSFPDSVEQSGLTASDVVLASVTNAKNKKHFFRPYSSVYTTANELQLAIKLENPEATSGAMHLLKPGDTVRFRGPKSRGIDLDGLKSINMVAGGSGIVPLYSISKYLMTEKKDAKVNLLFASKTPEDIMFKKELDELKKEHPGRMNITYVVNKNTSNAPDVVEGRIDSTMLKEKLWKESDAYVCGPERMESALGGRRSPIKSMIDGKVVSF